jgi:murein DD-endopeptidase MepM/ murein hydrolase activator NlpD
MRVTQDFGNNLYINGRYYYKQFGLKGHNGLDVVPTDTDRGVYNFFNGKILKIEYHKAYGNRVIIWNRANRLMEYHNHLKFVDKRLKVGKEIGDKTYLGEMGNTGVSMGAHDHVAFRKTNEGGYIVDRDNGYNGYLDALVYIS